MAFVDLSAPVDGFVDLSEPPKPVEGGLLASAKQMVGSTIKGAGQVAADFAPALVDPDNAATRYGQSVIDANPTAVHSLEDIAERPGTAVAEATGNAGASVAGMLGIRAAGQAITAAAPLAGPAAPAVALVGQAVAWLGPVAIAALPSYGSIRDKQALNDPEGQGEWKEKAKAAVGAATVGAIESKFGPQNWALAALTKEGRAELAKKFAATTYTGAAAKGAVKGGLIEGAEELVQNPIEQVAAGDDPTTAESIDETLFSGAMGAIGGKALGATAGVVTHAGASPKVVPPKPVMDAGSVDEAVAAFKFEVSGEKSDLTELRRTYKDATPEEITANQAAIATAYENDPTFAPDADGNPTAYGAPLRALAPQELPTEGEGLTRDAYEAIAALNVASGLKTVVYEDHANLPDGLVKQPDVVFISSKTSIDPAVIAAHEAQHLSEEGEPQSAYAKIVQEELTERAVEVARERHGKDLSDTLIQSEIRADITGDAWADPTFHSRVITKMREQLGDQAAEKNSVSFLDSIKNLIVRIKETLTGTTFTSPNGQRLATQYVKNLERVHDALAAAIADNFIQKGYRPPGAQTNTSQALVSRALERQSERVAAEAVPAFQRTAEQRLSAEARPIAAPAGASPELVSALAAAAKAPFDRTTEERLNLEAIRIGVRMSPKIKDEKVLRRMAEYEGRMFAGGAYSNARYESKMLAKDAPIKGIIELARKNYNGLRAQMGMPPITDWAARPEQTGEKVLRERLAARPGDIQKSPKSERAKIEEARYGDAAAHATVAAAERRAANPVDRRAPANVAEYATVAAAERRVADRRSVQKSPKKLKSLVNLDDEHPEGKPVASILKRSPDAAYVLEPDELALEWREMTVKLNQLPSLKGYHRYADKEDQFRDMQWDKLERVIESAPIIVLRNPDGTLEVVDGAHRLRAARKAGVPGVAILIADRKTGIQKSPKSEVAKLEAARSRTLVNIGLNVGDKKSVSDKQALAALKLVGVKVRASSVQQSDTEATLVAELDRPLTPTQAMTVARNLKQEAIAQHTGGKGELYGPKAKEWGPFNPAFFLTPDGKRLSEAKAPVKKLPTRTVRGLLKHLTEGEQKRITNRAAALIVEKLKTLPKSEEFAAVAYAGRAKRGWYARSAQTISDIFGPDGPRFAALLAALSPQTGVESNLRNALNVWRAWVQAGRPVERTEIIVIMQDNVEGHESPNDSVLPAWKNNSVRALTDEDPMGLDLSGPKVNSFFLNLIGYVNEVTNDTWMANYAGVEQKMFAGQQDTQGFGRKSLGYIAFNARVREAATKLTALTGEPWSPAEVQETIWSWAKATYEYANRAGEKRNARQVVKDQSVTHQMIASTPSFDTMFLVPEFRDILERAGYGEELQQLGSAQQDHAGQVERIAGAAREAGPFGREAQERHEFRAARRLDELADRAAQLSPKADQRRRAARAGEGARDAGAGPGGAGDQGRTPEGWSREVGPQTPSFRFHPRGPGKSPTTLVGVHYGEVGGLSELDPTRFGTGNTRSQEIERINSLTAPHLMRRVYFYAVKGGLPQGEDVVTGGHAYRILATNLYDTYEDPGGIIAQWVSEGRPNGMNGLESGFLASGYDGYFNRNHTLDGAFVIIGASKGVPVEYLGTRSDARGKVRFSPKKPSQKELLEAVRSFDNQYGPGEPGYGKPEDFVWSEQELPLSELWTDSDAREFFANEQKMWLEEGDPERFNDILKEPIHTPIIAVKMGGQYYIWDGNHRVAGSIVAGRTHIPAIVGLPKKDAGPQLSPKTPEFKKWFAGSKVVDEKGEPLVVYHGTAKDITEFAAERIGTNSNVFGSWQTGRSGIFFAVDPNLAGEFADPLGDANIIPVHLAIFDPIDLRKGFSEAQLNALEAAGLNPRYYNNVSPMWEIFDHENGGKDFVAWLRKEGYDGARITDHSVADANTEAWVALDPNQVKSIFNERPTADPRISFSPKIVGDSKRAYTSEQRRMFANTGRAIDTPSFGQRLADLRKDLGKKLAQGLVDQFAPLKELSPMAYMLARLSKGSAGALEALLHHGKLRLNAGAFDADRSGGFIERVGIPLQGELEDFLWWVAANRAERLSAQDRERLFSRSDIAAGKSLASGLLPFDYVNLQGTKTRDRKLAYADSLAKFEGFNKNALDMAEQSGLIDPQARAIWENEFYVPFYRVSEEDGSFIGGNIGNALVRQRAFKRLKGGEQKLHSDLLANTIANWAHLIDASAKNRAAKASLEAAANMGVAIEAPAATILSMGKSIGKNGVWFMDGGVRRHFLVDDPFVLTAITSLEYSGMKGPLMDAMSTMKHILTVGVTASPFFKVKNLIRDSLQAVAVSPIGANPLANVAQGIAASEHSTQTYVSALASGGLIRFGTMLEGRMSDRVRQLIKSGVKETSILNSDSKIRAMYDRLIEPAVVAYNELGNRSEEISRAALFTQLKSQGVDHATASLMARDLMDFSLQGSWSGIRFLTQVVPFMNARMQGLYKLGRGARDDPRRFAAVLGATAMFSVALLAAYSDDDDWKKREDWDRDNFWWFKIGGTAFRIPKPFEIGAIATLAERGLEYFTSPEMTGERLRKVTLALVANNLSMNPVPQLLKPLVDVYANKDSFTGRPLETLGMERLQPDHRFSGRTSMLARAAGTAGQSLTSLVGVDFISPVKIDHVLRGYFGWLGGFVVGTADAMVRPLTGEAERPAGDLWKLVTGNMVSELPTDQSRYVSQMYEQARVIEQAYGTYRSLLKQSKGAEAREYLEDNRDKISKYQSVQRVKRAEGQLNERIRIIERSALDPEAKRVAIAAIAIQKDRIARLVN